jgi:hypothetical protein
MLPREIEKKIIAMIRVTPQQVTLAKAFLLKNFKPSPSFNSPVDGINKLLEAMQVKMPDVICVHESMDSEKIIKQAAEAISWKLAGCEAIWGLISSNLLIPDFAPGHCSPDLNVPYSTQLMPAANAPKLSLSHLTIRLPHIVRIPYSSLKRDNQSLSDPDLFLHVLDIPNLHKNVETALREAVHCFHHELYLACLAMLGRSSEGAWIELGLKLIQYDESKKAEKLRDGIESPFVGIAKKIQEVVKLYNDKDSFDAVYRESGIRGQDLTNSVVWADAVRESRNSIHYGVEPVMPNSYEKVAALLIGAVPHLKVLYNIVAAVDRLRRQ